MKFLNKFLLIAFIALPFVLTFAAPGQNPFAKAEDATYEEDEEVQVEDAATAEVLEDAAEEEETEQKSQGSPDIECTILFTKPVGNGMELPAGKQVEFLLGVINTGDRDFILDGAEASFRYPMDFNFYIQNFTAMSYDKTVKSQQEATVMYAFYPAEVFAGRPLGLQINLAYHDADGQDFIEAVFNSTINIVEVDEGLDGETFFLYVFMFAFVALLVFIGHTVLNSYGLCLNKKSSVSKKPAASQKEPTVEMGTTKNGVDYEWLPDQLKAQLKKQSNGVGTRTSPRLRKP